MKGPPKRKDFKIDEACLYAEQVNRENAFKQAKLAYKQELVAYVKEHGIDSLSQEKLRMLLSANLIKSSGSKLIIQWRWEQYINDAEPVVRSKNYLKECDLPEYTVFSGPPVCGILHDIWHYCIFPYLRNHDLWRVMLTCKAFQSRAHSLLTERAKQTFGAGGTPMAIYCSMHIHGNDFIRHNIEQYGCIDHYSTLNKYKKEQVNAMRRDYEKEKELLQPSIDAINAICLKGLKIRYDKRCLFATCFYSHLLGDWKTYNQYLSTCTRLVNVGTVEPNKIKQALTKYEPGEFGKTILGWDLNFLPSGHESEIFFEFLYSEYLSRGFDWLKAIQLDRHDVFRIRTPRCFFISDQSGFFVRTLDYSTIYTFSLKTCQLDPVRYEKWTKYSRCFSEINKRRKL